MELRPSVTLQLKNRSELLAAFFHQGDSSGVFVAGNLRLNAGDEVALRVVIEEGGATFASRGVVRWKRLASRGDLPAGVGVGFPASERRTRDLLLDFAHGREVRLIKRQSPRYPVIVEVDYKSNSSFLSDVTDDLSAHGAFISTEHQFQPGEVVHLRLKTPGQFFAIKIEAVVRWNQAEGRPGVGVQFVFKNERNRAKVERLIATIEHRINEEFQLAGRH